MVADCGYCDELTKICMWFVRGAFCVRFVRICILLFHGGLSIEAHAFGHLVSNDFYQCSLRPGLHPFCVGDRKDYPQ